MKKSLIASPIPPTQPVIFSFNQSFFDLIPFHKPLAISFPICLIVPTNSVNASLILSVISPHFFLIFVQAFDHSSTALLNASLSFSGNPSNASFILSIASEPILSHFERFSVLVNVSTIVVIIFGIAVKSPSNIFGRFSTSFVTTLTAPSTQIAKFSGLTSASTMFSITVGIASINDKIISGNADTIAADNLINP